MENSVRNKKNLVNQNEINTEPFYHNEIVDVYDFSNKTSSEGMITSIRGDIYRVKYTDNNEEETIRDDEKLILRQCIKLR